MMQLPPDNMLIDAASVLEARGVKLREQAAEVTNAEIAPGLLRRADELQQVADYLDELRAGRPW
jgi:hypothetical protein